MRSTVDLPTPTAGEGGDQAARTRSSSLRRAFRRSRTIRLRIRADFELGAEPLPTPPQRPRFPSRFSSDRYWSYDCVNL
jgi:hypothetical protein